MDLLSIVVPSLAGAGAGAGAGTGADQSQSDTDSLSTLSSIDDTGVGGAEPDDDSVYNDRLQHWDETDTASVPEEADAPEEPVSPIVMPADFVAAAKALKHYIFGQTVLRDSALSRNSQDNQRLQDYVSALQHVYNKIIGGEDDPNAHYGALMDLYRQYKGDVTTRTLMRDYLRSSYLTFPYIQNK